jgi:hypothetical protein
MIQTGQIIFYDSDKMMCFDVKKFMVKEPEKQMIETTLAGDEERHFIQSTPEPICVFIETGEELVKLDPTTMKRIARYNLEEENAALLKEIEERKKVIANLEQKEDVLHDRYRKAIATFKEIMENGCYDDGEDEDEDEWE